MHRLKWEEESRKRKQRWEERERASEEILVEKNDIRKIEAPGEDVEMKKGKTYHAEGNREACVRHFPSALEAKDGRERPLEKDFHVAYVRTRKKVYQSSDQPQLEKVVEDEKPVEEAFFKHLEIVAEEAPRGSEIESRRKEQTAMEELLSRTPTNAGQGEAVLLPVVLKSGLVAGRNRKTMIMAGTREHEDGRGIPKTDEGPTAKIWNNFVCCSKELGLLLFGPGLVLTGPDITQVDHGPSHCLALYSGPTSFLLKHGWYSKSPQTTQQNQFSFPTLLFQFHDVFASGAFSEEIVALALQQPWKVIALLPSQSRPIQFLHELSNIRDQLRQLSRPLFMVIMVELLIVKMAYRFAWLFSWAETESGRIDCSYKGHTSVIEGKVAAIVGVGLVWLILHTAHILLEGCLDHIGKGKIDSADMGKFLALLCLIYGAIKGSKSNRNWSGLEWVIVERKRG